MSLSDYGLYFGLTLLLSTLFGIGGVGSAIALVPTLSSVGVAFALARALGLFVNTISTVTASITHFRWGVLDIRFAMPLVITIIAATPIGAWASQFVPHPALEAVLAVFLLVAAALLLFSQRPTLAPIT